MADYTSLFRPDITIYRLYDDIGIVIENATVTAREPLHKSATRTVFE
jgi:hypothetical protein